MVSEVIEYDVIDDFGENRLFPYFENEGIEYSMLGSYLSGTSIHMLIFRTVMTTEDALILQIKYPTIEIKKISNYSKEILPY